MAKKVPRRQLVAELARSNERVRELARVDRELRKQLEYQTKRVGAYWRLLDDLLCRLKVSARELHTALEDIASWPST